MPTVTNAKLTLTRQGANIKIDVTYNVNFSRVESNLIGLGLRFTELVHIVGADPPGSTTGTLLHTIAAGFIPVQGANQGQTVARSHTRTVTRGSLDEDPDVLFPDADELICRVQVRGSGLQLTPGDAFTNQVVLSNTGGVND